MLVGPDNGLLSRQRDGSAGSTAVHVLEAEAYRLPVVSTSFHGRDLFAPAAAHLARGVPIAALGRPLDPAGLVPSPLAEPVREDGALRSAVVYVDTFGNVKLGGLRSDLEGAVGPLRPGDRLAVRLQAREDGSGATGDLTLPWQATFGDAAVGELLLYEDSYGRICLAANQADAAAMLGLVEDQPVVLRR